MIWSGGKILDDNALSISVIDRTFEHGLGLFETLRTWGGRPTLLDRHNARMLKSAQELKLSIDPASLPDTEAVRLLLGAEGIAGDRMFRITASGGTSTSPSVVWMRSSPLPPPIRDGGAILYDNSRPLIPNDFTARHKTLNYWFRRAAYEAARELGYDETLVGPGAFYYEGTRSNLFLIEGDRICTPSLEAPIVPGIMRQLVLEIAQELPLKVLENKSIDGEEFRHADEVFLTNAVRGIIPVAKVNSFDQPAPGPWTRRLQAALARRLDLSSGGVLPT